MVTIGLLSGLVPLVVFVVCWHFGVSSAFLRLIGSEVVLYFLLVSLAGRRSGFYVLRKITKLDVKKTLGQFIRLDKLDKVVLIFIFIFLLINIIGVFVPEVGFDALWYHLTIPKIFIQEGYIDFIPGGLYYYSVMPKLTEIWYMISLVFDKTGTLAKLIHFTYGLGCLVLVYQLSTKLMSRKYTLMAVLATVSTLVFCWESGSAYIDLAWTFYTLLALSLYCQYRQDSSMKQLVLVGVASGLAIGTKLPAVIPAVILSLFICKKNIKHAMLFIMTGISIAWPWFIFAWLKTGNPFYPLFTNIYPAENIITGISIFNFIKISWQNLTWPQDPFSIFIGFLAITPFIIRKKLKDRKTENLNWLWSYLVLNYFAWYLLFRTSGSRFLLPLLPGWIIACLAIWYRAEGYYYKILYGVLIFSSLINLVYRSATLYSGMPLLLGKESRQDYLLSKLSFNFGDFYDRDGWVKAIVKDDAVLVYGFHNLFYAGFNFVHESQTETPDKYKYWLSDKPLQNVCGYKLLYSDLPTKVYLYSF